MNAHARHLILLATCWFVGLPIGLAQQPKPKLQLVGHDAPISSVDYAPSGDLLATGASDQFVKLWNAKTGKELRVFSGHTGQVLCVGMAPNGQLLFSGASDNTIRMWDVPQTKPIQQLQGHDGPALGLSVSSDGRFAVSVGDDKKVNLWRLSDGKKVHSFVGHEQPVGRAAFRIDGNQIASGDKSGVIRLWNPTLQRSDGQLHGHLDEVTGLSFASNNQQLISSGADGLLKVWQLPLAPPRTLPSSTSELNAIARSPNGSLLAVGGATVQLYQASNGQPVRELKPKLLTNLLALAFSPNSQMLAAADATGGVLVWNVANGQLLHNLQGHQSAARSLAFLPDGGRLVSSGDDGAIRVWQLPPAAQVLTGHSQPVRSIAVSSNLLATTSADKSVRIWSQNGQPVRQLVGHQHDVLTSSFRADAAQLATADAGGVLRLWKVSTGAEEGVLQAANGPISGIAYSDPQQLISISNDTVKTWRLPVVGPAVLAGNTQAVLALAVDRSAKRVLTGGADGGVRLFEGTTGQPLRSLAGQTSPATAVAISVDGALSAAAGETGEIRLWSTEAGEPKAVLQGPPVKITRLSFQPTAMEIASAAANGDVSVWTTTPASKRLVGHSGPVHDVSSSDDGKLFATASDDKTVRLWKQLDGSPVRALSGHEQPVSRVAIRNDGGQLASGDASGVIRLWKTVDGAAEGVLAASPSRISHLSFASSGNRLLSASENQLRSWRLPLTPPRVMWTADASISVATFSPDGKRVAVAVVRGGKPILQLRERETGKLLAAIPGHEGPITAIAFSADGKRLATGSVDKTVRVWNVADKTQLSSFMDLKQVVTDVAFAANGSQVVSAGGNTIKVSEAEKGEEIRTLAGHTGAVQSLVVFKDTLLSGAADGTVKQWNINSGANARTVKHGAAVVTLAISPDGTRFASSGADKSVKLWRLSDGGAIKTLAVGPQTSTTIAYSSDSTRIATSCQEGVTRIWDVGNAAVLQEFPGGQAAALMFSADAATLDMVDVAKTMRRCSVSAERVVVGKQDWTDVAVSTGGSLVAGVNGKSLRVWQVGDGKLLHSWEAPATLTSVSFRGDDQLAVAADTKIHLWRSSNGASWTQQPSLTATVRIVKYSRDGARLLIADATANLRVLSAEDGSLLEVVKLPAAPTSLELSSQNEILASTGNLAVVEPFRLRRRIRGHQGSVTGISYTPDGGHLVTTGADKTVRLWKTDGGLLAQFGGLDSPASSLSIAGNGKSLAVGAGKSVLVWLLSIPAARVEAPKQSVAKFSHAAPVSAVDLAAEGGRIAVGGVNGRVTVWDVASSRQLQGFETTPGSADCVSITADGQRVLSAGRDKVVRIWPINCTGLVRTKSNLTELRSLPNGKQYVTISETGPPTLWDNDGKQVREFLGGEGRFVALAARADSAQVAAAASGKVFVWSVKDGKLLASKKADGEVSALAYSPDHRRLAVSVGERVVQLDTDKLQHLESTVASSAIGDIAFAPDSGSILMGLENNQVVRRLNALTSLLRGHDGSVTCLASSPNGLTLFSGGQDKSIRAWSLASGKQIGSLTGCKDPIADIVVTSNSAQLLAASGHDIRSWALANVSKGAPIPSGDVWQTPAVLRDLSLSADQSKLAAASDDGLVRVYEVSTGLELQRFPGHKGSVRAVSFMSDNKTLYSAGADKSCRVSKLAILRVIQAHDGRLHDFALAASGAQAVTTGADQKLKLWNLANGQVLREYKGHNRELRRLAVRTDGAQVAATGGDQIYFWTLSNGAPGPKVALPSPARSIAFSRDNKTLAALSEDKTFRIVQVDGGEVLQEQTLEQPGSQALFVRQDRQLLIAREDGGLGFWTYAAPGAVKTFTGHGGNVYANVVSPDGSTLASCSTDQSIRLWSVKGGNQLRQLSGHQGPVYGIAFNPDGGLLASCGADKTVRLWDVTGGRQLKQIDVGGDALYSISFNKDGKRVAVGGLDKQIHVVDVFTGARLTTLKGHADYVYRVQWNSNGTRLLSCGYGGNIKIWNVSDGKSLFDLGLSRVINSAAYSPDGSNLVVVGGDGRASIFEIPIPAR